MMNELSTERAIEALYTVRAYYASLTAGYPKGKDCRGIGDVMCSEIANSCLMAIKALEQIELNPSYNGVKTELESCEDCVSRQAIKEMLSEEWTKYMPMELDINLSFVMEKINELPSVTPKARWIPVSESLPKAFEFVNCTCHSLIDDREDWVIETVYVPQPSDSPYSDWGNIPMLNSGDCKVVAWVHRDIPEPYKAESEDKE